MACEFYLPGGFVADCGGARGCTDAIYSGRITVGDEMVSLIGEEMRFMENDLGGRLNRALMSALAC